MRTIASETTPNPEPGDITWSSSALVLVTSRSARTRLTHRAWAVILAGSFVALAQGASSLFAATIDVPNGSFESPTPPAGFPATPQIDVWQKSPQPAWFDPATAGIAWSQLSGVFPNTAPGSGDHIDNVDANQAAYIFTLPQVALFQELNATFEIGSSYDLTLGILGGGGITEGSSFELSLYYRDNASSLVPVAATPITYQSASFPNSTHLIDYQVHVPTVQAGDAWAGQSIGVQLASTFGTGAGYWDVDNVRLAVVPEPATFGLLALGISGIVIERLRARPRA